MLAAEIAILNLAPLLASGDPDQSLVELFLSGLPGGSAIAIYAGSRTPWGGRMAPLPLALVAATLAAGTPALTMVGAIGAALTVSLRRGGLLMAILVLPLTIPVLIFGVAAASAASGGAAPFLSPFLALCALSLAAIALAPFAAAAALRHARE